MSWEAWFTLAVVLAVIAVLATERFSPPVTIIGAVTVLLLAHVIDAKAALSGFSNEAPVTIAALYVVAGAAESTGALEGLTRLILSGRYNESARPRRPDLLRMMVPTAGMSAFIYNTPLTSMLAPRVTAWSRRTGRLPSWFLMPMNLAVLCGGLITAIGTTTNVVISGLLTASHRAPLSFFEPTPVGIAVTVAVIPVVVVLAPLLVRHRRTAEETFSDTRTFTVEMTVPPGSPIAGKTIAEAGLRNLEGVFLVEILHDGASVAAVGPERRLAEGDRLVFAGNVKRVLDLQRMPGLASAETPHFSVAAGPDRLFFEAVVAAGSPLVGHTLKSIGVRSRYEAAVVAVHRGGEQVRRKLGDVTLRAGDVLLVLATGDFRQRFGGGGDFALIAQPDGNPAAIQREKAWIVTLIVVGFVASVTTGVLSVLDAALIAALLIIVLRIVTPWQARHSIDLNVLVVLCGSFGIGAAVGQSGLAREIARLLIDALHPLGGIGILAGVLLATVVITQVVTNNAAAVLMFPIAVATAAEAHLGFRAFVLALVVGASASFLTPIGYQTNMMVYGPGGYRFTDFLRVGAPLNLLLWIVAVVLIPVFRPF